MQILLSLHCDASNNLFFPGPYIFWHCNLIAREKNAQIVKVAIKIVGVQLSPLNCIFNKQALN